MSRFAEKSTIPIRANDWSGSADSVIESIQPGIIVIAYGNHSSTTTVNRVRDECKLKGAYFLKTHLQNPNRILDEVQKHVLFETA